MRRIYYAYALHFVGRPGVLQGALMFTALVALTRFVSLGNVLTNLMGVEVGHVGTFFYNAVMTTEAWTLLLLGIFIYSAFSFRFTIRGVSRAHQLAKA